MTKNISICERCQSKLVEYTHTMSNMLASILERFTIDSKGAEMEFSKTSMTHTQIANAQKLKYWELIEKGTTPNTWKVTLKGIQFLNNMIAISQQVRTFRGKRLGYSREIVYFNQLTGHSYETRQDYAREAIPIKTPEGEQMRLA